MLGLVIVPLIYSSDFTSDIQKTLKQRSFQTEAATSLILQQAQRSHHHISTTTAQGVYVGVTDDVLNHQISHWSVKCDKCGCRKFFKINSTTTLCEHCDVHFCFSEERNYFKC